MQPASISSNSNNNSNSTSRRDGITNSTGLLFQQQIPMLVKFNSNQQPHSISKNLASKPISAGRNSGFFSDSNRQLVTVSISIHHNGSSGNTSSSSSGRLLVIRLTQDEDPFFLFRLEIGEDDYFDLKASQNLLVDFSQFPNKLIELLNECGSLNEQQKQQDLDTGAGFGRFVAQFTQSPSQTPSTFSVVETNSFRNISHISLQFVSGSDEELKQYLASLVSTYRSDLRDSLQKLLRTEQSLSVETSRLSQENARLKRDLEASRVEYAAKEAQITSKLTTELAQEREKLFRERDSLSRDAESTKTALVVRFEQQLAQTNQELADFKRRFDALTAEHKSTCSELDQCLRAKEQILKDNSELQVQLRKNDSERISITQEKSTLLVDYQSAKNQIELLEQKVTDSRTQLLQLEQTVKINETEKLRLEDSVTNLTRQLADCDTRLKQQTQDNSKANEIIIKLQTELKSVKGKLKLKSTVTSQQEKLLDEKQVIVDTTQKEFSDLKDSILKKDEELKQLRSTIEKLTQKTEADKKVIDENNSVIEWLHRQLNEDAIRRPLSGIEYGTTVPGMKPRTAPLIRNSHQVEKKLLSSTSMKYLNPSTATTTGGNPTSIPGPGIQNNYQFSSGLAKVVEHPGRSSDSALPFKSNYFK